MKKEYKKCDYCDGKGKTILVKGGMLDGCDGEEKCPVCQGYGEVLNIKTN